MRKTDKSKTISFDLKINNDLLSPVKLKRDGDRISWTPRIFSEDLFDNRVKNSFYIQLIDDKDQLVYQDYTKDFEYKIPDELLGMKLVVSVAALDKNKTHSGFAKLI